MHKQWGFTLIELMVLVAIIAILAIIAVPNFSATVKGSRDITQINTLATGLALARSEAVKSGSNVTICSSNDGTSCTGSSWNDGWLVRYVTPPPNTSTVIRVFPALGADSDLTVAPASGAITFNSTGMTNLAGTANFTLCDGRGAQYAHSLDVLISGVTQTSSTPGEDVAGNALSCP